MEVIIGVMLLIGAFALGQSTDDRASVETQVRVEREQIVESSEAKFFIQDCRYRVDGPVQRNLTVPFGRQLSSDETRVSVGNE